MIFAIFGFLLVPLVLCAGAGILYMVRKYKGEI